jgi:hypothetical protein
MNSMMAFSTKRDPVGYFISQFRVGSPRHCVMNVQFASTLPARLASIVVPVKSSITEIGVFGAIETFVSNCRMTSLPIPMLLSYEVIVARGNTASPFSPFSNFLLVFFRQGSAPKRISDGGNGFFSCFLRHQLSLSVGCFSTCRYFSPHIEPLSNVVVQVGISNSTRITTKKFTPAFIGFPALEAYIGE